MIDSNKYKSIYRIPLPTSPNASFNTSLEGDTFDIEFRVIGQKVLITIKLGDQVLVNGTPLRWDIPLNFTSRYKYSKGDFWIEGSGKEDYEHLQRGEFYFGSF